MRDLVKELLEAPSCCPELRDAAEKWLKAEGTDEEAEATEWLLKEIKLDIIPVDALVEFMNSPAAEGIFGDKTEQYRNHANELKANGAEFCDCPACTAGLKILECFGE